MDYKQYTELTKKWLSTSTKNDNKFAVNKNQSYYLDEVNFSKKNNILLFEIAKIEGFKKPEAFVFGLLQRRIKFLLESVLNSYDYGLDGREITKDDFFKKEHLGLDKCIFYTETLENNGYPEIKTVKSQLLEANNSDADVSVNIVASIISSFYLVMPTIVKKMDISLTKRIVKKPPLLNRTTYLNEDKDYRKPVIKIAEFLEKETVWAFDAVYLHGSLSTCDYVRGCSDLDTFAIVNHDVAKSSELLLKLRKQLLPIWKFLYQIDPLQHHGLMLCAEQDADFYPQYFFPLVLFKYSKTLWKNSEKPLVFYERNSNYEKLQSFFQVLHDFQNGSLNLQNPPNVERLKYYLQLLILLPTLYFGTQSNYMYKRDSFSLLESEFNKSTFKIINHASTIRKQNLYGFPNEISDSLIKKQNEFSTKDWIKLFQQKVHHTKSTIEIKKILGPEIDVNVEKFCTTLTKKSINNSKKDLQLDIVNETNQCNIEYTNWPILFTLEEYDLEAKKISSGISKIFTNISILQHGSISVPGISDLDLILVIRKSQKPEMINQLKDFWNNLDQKSRYLCYHLPFIMPQQNVSELSNLWPLSSCKIISGNGEYNFKSNLSWKNHILTTIEVITFINFLQDLMKPFLEKILDVRLMLMHLKSITYSIKILKDYGLTNKIWDDFVSHVDKTRSEWFEIDRSKQQSIILDLVKDGIWVQLNIIDALKKIAPEFTSYPLSKTSDHEILGILDEKIFFMTNWTPSQFLKTISQELDSTNGLITPLPAEFLPIIVYYQKNHGILEQALDLRLLHKIDSKKIYPSDELKKRRSLIEEILVSTKKLGLEKTIFPIGIINSSPISQPKSFRRLLCELLLFDNNTNSLTNFFHLESNRNQLQKVFDERSKWANTLDVKATELESSISTKNSEIEGLESAISTKNSEIENLQNSLYDLKGKFSAQEHSILFGAARKISRGLDKSFPSQTKRGEILRLLRNAILIGRNEGLDTLFQESKQKIKKEHIPQKTKYALGIRKLPKPEIPKIDSSEPKTKPFVIHKSDIRKVNKQLRHFIQPGSANVLNLTSYPKVSIIIATYNQIGFLKKALKSIESKTTYKNYEIVIVTNNIDEKSEMRQFLNSLKYPIYVYTEEYSWGAMNNFAVNKATGDFIVILNDDVEIITPFWLEGMLSLASDNKVAAVGPKLLFPNGKLQEAGCIIWQNGTGWNYGRNGNPGESDYNFVRVVDYCTACCLMFKKSLFEKMNGFDLRYEIGYYEDTDLCFSLAQAGYRVVYQPISEIIHHEGRTQGTDVYTGNKSYQLKNAKKFYQRWKEVLKDRNSDSLENSLLERNRKKGANILFIDHYLPEFDKDSGSLDTFYNLGILSYLDHKVTFWPDNQVKTEPYITELQQKSIEVISRQNFESFIKKRGWLFHLCFLTRPHVSIKYIDLIKKYAPQCKIVYDTIDLHHIQQSRQAIAEKNSSLLDKSYKTRQMEYDIFSKSDIIIVKSNEEANILLKKFPSSGIAIIPPYRISEDEVTPFDKRKDLLFVGGFHHPPNIDAVKNLISNVFPKIKEKITDVKLYIIGSNPTKEIADLCSDSDGVVFLGYVKNLKQYLQKTRVMIAPLRYGAGIKGKLVESLANGLPIVTTSIGAEGITKKDADFLYIADDENEFAKKTADLYNNKDLWNRFSTKGKKYAEAHFSPELAKETLEEIIYECIKNY